MKDMEFISEPFTIDIYDNENKIFIPSKNRVKVITEEGIPKKIEVYLKPDDEDVLLYMDPKVSNGKIEK